MVNINLYPPYFIMCLAFYLRLGGEGIIFKILKSIVHFGYLYFHLTFNFFFSN